MAKIRFTPSIFCAAGILLCFGAQAASAVGLTSALLISGTSIISNELSSFSTITRRPFREMEMILGVRGLREAAVDAASIHAEKTRGFGNVAAGLFESAMDEGLFGFLQVQ